MARKVTLLHLNDVYNIEGAKNEPVGGAARLVTLVNECIAAGEDPLVVFSGDLYNPSLLSTITKGKQMPSIMNAAHVAVACLGNHDLDYGIENFMALGEDCNFPWLCTNATDVVTGTPLAGCKTHLIIEHSGVKFGFMGLIEGDWLGCIAAVDADQVQYEDYVPAARKCAAVLKEEGAEVIVALTHMRWPGDERLAAEVPEVDIVLGGHDHDAGRKQVGNTWVIKSGTDFRQMTKLACSVAAGQRPTWEWEDIQVTSSVKPDPSTQAVVEGHLQSLKSKMGIQIGDAGCDLDGRFSTVRSMESNLGNMVADVLRSATKADCVLLNSGTLRSDRIHKRGPILMEDLFAMLPMIDATIVIGVSGKQLLGALENGVSKYPALEGRFPQVAGLSFKFDPSKPAGSRVLPGSVHVGDKPLEEGRTYSMATKEFMFEGKDGYDCLQGAEVIMDADVSPVLPTCLRNYFTTMEVLNLLNEKKERMMRWKHNTDRILQRTFTHGETGLAVMSKENSKYVCKPAVQGRIVCVAPQ